MIDQQNTSTSSGSSEIIAPTEISTPISSPKPYDDEMLNAYETEATSEKDEKNDISPEAQTLKETKESKQVDAKSSKNDKIEDNFEDVAVKKPINGKEVEFKIKDAIQAYVKQEEFNRSMDARLTQIDQKERALQQQQKAWIDDQQNFKDKIGQVMKLARQGDFVTVIRGLAKLAVGNSGLDVVELEKAYFGQLDQMGKVYGKMTPEQREAFFAKRALAEAEARARELEEEKSTNVEKSQLQEKVASLQKTYNIPEQVFWENYKILEQNQVGDSKLFKAAQEIKPEDVIKFSLQVNHELKVLEAGKKLGIDAEDPILDEVSRITSTNPTLTSEDIVRIITDSGVATNASPKAVENLNRKAEKSRSNPAANSTKKQNGKIDGYDKESLDFLYRNQPRAYTRIVR